MQTGLARTPEVMLIADETGLDEFAVIGRLHAVWSWLDEQTEDGQIRGVTIPRVDRIANYKGFGAAMERAGWLSEKDNVLIAPNFGKHNGSTAKQRANSSLRMGKLRSKRNGSVTPANISYAESVPRGEENRIEEIREENNTVRKSSSSSSARDGDENRGGGGGFLILPEEERRILLAIAERLYSRTEASLRSKEIDAWKRGRPDNARDTELTLEDIDRIARYFSEDSETSHPRELWVFLEQRLEKRRRMKRFFNGRKK